MSSARKLINSKITPSTSTSSSSRHERKLPLIVLENMGASRYTDMVEVYRLVQHLTTQIHQQKNGENKENTNDPQEIFSIETSKNHKKYVAQTLGVPENAIAHVVLTEPSSNYFLSSSSSSSAPQRRERISNNNNNTDDRNNNDSSPQENENSSSSITFDLVWHYGWSFSVLVPVVHHEYSSPISTLEEFCQKLSKALNNFKPQGRRIERGSAAQKNNKANNNQTQEKQQQQQDNADADEKDKIPFTTLPVDIVSAVEPDVPLSQIIQLYEAASPPVKLCGFPSSFRNFQNHNQSGGGLSSSSFFLQTPNLPGLFMLTNFLTEQDEKEMLDLVHSWETNHDRPPPPPQGKEEEKPSSSSSSTTSWQTLNLRRVRHFGRRFDYSTNNVFEEKDLAPLQDTPWVKNLLERIHQAMRRSKQFETLPEKEWAVDQMTVSEYKPGAGIPPHLDHPQNFGAIVIAVAVGAPTLFEFSKVVAAAASKNNGDDDDDAAESAKNDKSVRENTKCSVLFPPRALMVMQEEARYGWKHSIAARGRDYLFLEECVDGDHCSDEEKNHSCLTACSLDRGTRISFTFRRVTMHDDDEKK